MTVTLPEIQTADPTEIALLHEKLDHLTELLEAQEHRQQELDELKSDLIPIANHAIKLSIDELAEIGTEFRLEDLLFLLKRLLRSTPLLLRILDQMEALSSLGDEAEMLGKQVFSTGVEALDRLERRGYFAFAREGAYILDQIVSEFSDEDVRALGDNIVTILKTVRNMTQPEIMGLANRAVDAMRGADIHEGDTSLLALARELRDPQVRKGMARLLSMLRVLADQPTSPDVN